MIGPWNIKVGQQLFTLDALTMIDTDTNLTEACTIQQKTSQHVAMKFENTWLSRYPKPMRCIHDNGGEFIGHPLTDVPTTIKNPQANALIKQTHLSIGDKLRTTVLEGEYFSYKLLLGQSVQILMHLQIIIQDN